MANTLTLTVDILTKNAKDLDDLTGKVGKLDTAAGNAAPKADKLGGGISATTIAAGAAGVALGLLAGKVIFAVRVLNDKGDIRMMCVDTHSGES